MKRLLLDTNVVVWLLLGQRDAVSKRAREALEGESSRISVSAVSVWEIAIKRSLGKLAIEGRWAHALRNLDLDPMPMTAEHAERVERLPWHHRDPFDRLLIAQAMLEEHALVSADARMSSYGPEAIW